MNSTSNLLRSICTISKGQGRPSLLRGPMRNDCMGPNLGRNKDNNYYRGKCGVFGSAGTTASTYVECTLYGEERGRWRGAIRDLKDGMEEYEIIKGYRVRTEKK